MKLFKNKVNIILSLVLLILIGIGVILGLKFFAKPEVIVVDFKNMNEQEVLNWAKENEVEELIEFEHEYDDEIEKDKVIYQSLKEGEELTDSILIIISNGPDMSEYIVIPIDTIKTEEEFKTWLETSELTNVSFDYDNESELEEGTIISIKPDKAKKNDLVVVKVASNKSIDVPDFSYMSDKEISNWAKENNVKVNYVYETSSLEKDSFIKQSIKAGEKVAKNTVINITLSSGNQTKDANTAYIDPYDYLGQTEEKFTKALKDLGFTNVVKKEEVYSSKYAKGTICYYLPDGKQKLDTKIEYKVSKGKEGESETKSAYIDETKYLGQTEEKFTKALKDLGFTNVVKKEEVYSSKYAKGTICYYLPDGNQKLDTKIEYKVSKGKEGESETKTAYIDPYDYLGQTEEKFTKALKDLGFTNVVKKEEVYSSKYAKGTICYYLPDGNQKLDTKIEYKVSKGKEGETQTNTAYIDPNTYLGKTESEFTTALKNLGFTNVVRKEDVYSDNYAAGTVCYYLPDGNQKLDTKIEYKVSKGKEPTQEPPEVVKATILEFETMESFYSKQTYNDTKNAISNYFTNAGFTNVTYVGVESSVSVGTIVSIEVNGSTNYSSSTQYELNTPIRVSICNVQK